MIRKSIPSFITALNLACGVLAILVNDVRSGVFLIFLAAIFDVFDGLAARTLNAASAIGQELDSLADIVSFGVAPAILLFKVVPKEEYVFYLAPIFIAVAGAFRLARFNVSGSDKKHFEGLAIPASGLLVCGIVIAIYYTDPVMVAIAENNYLITGIALLIGILNVSKVKMFSLKQVSKVPAIKYYFFILIVAGILLYIFFPYLGLPLIIGAYIVLSMIDHYLIKSY